MADYKSSGIPFLRSKEVIEISKNQEISLELFINIEHYNKIETKFGVPEIDDILLTSVGTIGVPLLVSQDMLPFYFKDGNLIWFSNFSEKLNPKWLYQWLKSQVGQNQIHAFSIGSTQKALTIEALRKIKLSIPNREKQDRIAKVLENYSDSLRLNNRTIGKLRDTIQALFRSWFIDFDPVKSKAEGKLPFGIDEETAALFPDSFEDSELGPIPSGWNVGRIGDIADISSGKHQPERSEQKSSEYCTPLLGGTGIIAWTTESLFDEPIIVIGRVGTLGVVKKYISPVWPSDNTLIFKSHDKSSFHYLLHRLKLQDYGAYNRGSTQPLLTQSDMRKLKLIIPNGDVLLAFEERIRSMILLSGSLEEQSKSLTKTRDTLLPRLMSGELEI